MIQNSINQMLGTAAGALVAKQKLIPALDNIDNIANNVFGAGGAEEARANPELAEQLRNAGENADKFIKEQTPNIQTAYANYELTGDEDEKPYITSENEQFFIRQKAVEEAKKR